METTAAVSFKEWACVVRALGTGEQILILRKGGIHEKGKKFDVAHESFFLFPTYEHQNPEDLNPRGQELLREVMSGVNAKSSEQLTIEYFAEVQADFWVGDFSKLQKLSPFHVWSENAMRKRFDWGGKKGLFAIAARVYKLAQPRVLKHLPAYGGCRSWVSLDASIPISGMTPVLSAADFQRRLQIISRLVHNPF